MIFNINDLCLSLIKIRNLITIMSKEHKWKDLLLSSGLLLEFEVKKIMEKQGASYVWTGVEYQRLDEDNKIKRFSYDILAGFHNLKEKDIALEFQIECKFRTEDKTWFFIPNTYVESKRAARHYVAFNDLLTENNISKEIFLNTTDYPYCSYGIELLKDNTNPKTIKQAVSQLSYAISHVLERQTINNFGLRLNREVLYYNIPLIVTTAELRVLKPDITIEEFRNADKYDDISFKTPIIALDIDSTEELRDHNLLQLIKIRRAALGDEDIYSGNIERAKKMGNKFRELKDEDLNLFINQPKQILVLHHDKEGKNLNSFIEKIIGLINKVDKCFSS